MGGKKSLSKQNEEIVEGYFKDRGWEAPKLDRPRRPDRDKKAADLRICHLRSGYCFLCEVKTISSARANIPYGPAKDYMRDKRDKEKALLDNYKKAHPDTHLLVTPEEYEFLHGDEGWFNKKYQGRDRGTEDPFRKGFIEPTKKYLLKSSTGNLPYIVRVDSDDLYLPNQNELRTFWEWLETELPGIHRGTPSHFWQIVPKGPGSSTWYSAFYPIHKRAHENDVNRTIQMTVIGPTKSNKLEVEIHPYGTLNLDAVTRNVEEALGQLESSALKEQKEKIPRVVVLAFAGGVDVPWWLQGFENHLASLLKEHSKLSALALLDWVSEGHPPPFVPRFMVYHNSWLRDVEPLSPEVFGDNRSVQFRHINGSWQAL